MITQRKEGSRSATRLELLLAALIDDSNYRCSFLHVGSQH